MNYINHYRTNVRKIAFLAILYLPFVTQLAAQDAPKAFFMVDIDLQKIRSNDLFSNIVDKTELEDIFPEFYGSGLSVSDIKRIRAAAAPSVFDFALVAAKTGNARSEKMEELGMFKAYDPETYDEKEEEKKYQQLEEFNKKLLADIMKQRPEFFVQIEFTSARAAKSIMENEQFASEFSDHVLDGKKIKRTPAGEMLGFYYDGNTKITFASDKYLTGSNSLDPVSAIEQYFSAYSDRAVRVAVDLDSVRPQIKKIKELGEVPPMVFGIVNAIRSASMAVDLTNDELANFAINTDNEENAELIASQINGLLRMAQMQASQAANELFTKDSAESKSMIEFVKGIECTVDGATAKMQINKPDGFEKIVARAAEKASEAAKLADKMNYFREVAIGLHNAHDAYKGFPFAEPAIPGFNKDLSWRVIVLPFMENGNLYDKFDTKQAWDSENNMPLVKEMPRVYGFGVGGNKTSICWIKASDRRVRLETIRDGASNTIMLMENPNMVTWCKPDDLSINEAVNLVKNLKDGEELVIVFYDASVRTVSNKMDIEMFKAMLTPNGGEIVDWEKIR